MKMISRKRWIILPAVLFLAVAAPLAVLCWRGSPPGDFLTRRSLQGLPGSGQEPALALRRLRHATAMDAEGLPVLVNALLGGQEPMAVAAYEALNELLDRWQLLSSAKSLPKLASLARLMAEQSRGARPEALRHASHLALRMLVWPVDRAGVETPQMVSDCETVLRSAARAEVGWPSASATLRALPLDDRNASAGGGHFLRRLTIDPPAAHFPGGGLPVELTNLPPLPRARLDSREGANVQGGAHDPAEAGSPASSIPVSLVQPVSRETDSPPPQDPQAAPASGSTAERAGENAALLPDLALMRQLAAGDPRVASAAEEELRRRGYLPLHLALARRLVDPDTSARLALAEALPQIAGIDARPWLRWLAHDPDPRVRKAAIAIIATSSDPALRAQLRAVEREEPDPEILHMLRGILEPRRAE